MSPTDSHSDRSRDLVETEIGPPLGSNVASQPSRDHRTPQLTAQPCFLETGALSQTLDDTAGEDDKPTLVPFVATSASETLQKQFGRYNIERLLGRGGMGAVYLAYDTVLNRRVAIKLPHFGQAGSEGDELRARFYREARAAAALRHPNLCPVFDVGEIDGMCYLSMAYIEGRALSHFIDAQHLQSQRTIVLTIRKIALGLQEAHSAGIVHRDLKPANILIDAKNEPVVMDFGLSAPLRTTGTAAHDADVRQTLEGTILGTPLYMSPEQAAGRIESTGPASDLYSLGVIFYEMLTGKTPFSGAIFELLRSIVSDPPAPPSRFRPDLDSRLEAICLKLLQKDPGSRWSSAREFADQLTDWLRNSEGRFSAEKAVPTKRLRLLRQWPLGLAAAVGLFGGAAFVWFGMHPAASESSSGISQNAVDLASPVTAPAQAEYEALAPGPWFSLLPEARRLHGVPAGAEQDSAFHFDAGSLVFRGFWSRNGLLRVRLATAPEHRFELRLRSQVPTAALTSLQRYVSLRWDEDSYVEIMRGAHEKVERVAAVQTPAPGKAPWEMVLSVIDQQLTGYVNGRKVIERTIGETETFGVPVVTTEGPVDIQQLDWHFLPPEIEPTGQRRMAKSFLRRGCTIQVSQEGTNREIATVEDLPSGEIIVTRLSLPLAFVPTADDLHMASTSRSLNELILRGSDDQYQLAAVIPSLTTLQDSDSRVTPAGIALLAGKANLYRVSIEKAHLLGDAGARGLAASREIVQLTMSNAGITDEGLKSLAEFQKLSWLTLFGNQITGAGLANLERLDQLAYLGLWNNPVTDAGLQQVPTLRTLESLDLGPCQLEGPGLAALSRFPGLSVLRLYALQLSQSGWEHLPDHAALKRLEFHGCSISDEVVPVLTRFPNVSELHLDMAPVSDAAVESLARLKALKKLALWKTKVTPDGLKRFSELRPDCTLIPDPQPQPANGTGGGFF